MTAVRCTYHVSPSLERFTVGLTARQLVLFFSEGVAFSAFEAAALSLSYDNGTVKNASLRCSAAARGRGDSWREIVLHLDEPCATSNVSSWGRNDTSSGGNVSLAYVGGYPSDWDKLVEVGVLSAEAGGATDGIFLNATSEFVTDLSAAAHALIEVTNLKEDFPGEGVLNNDRTRLHVVVLEVALMSLCAPPNIDMFTFLQIRTEYHRFPIVLCNPLETKSHRRSYSCSGLRRTKSALFGGTTPHIGSTPQPRARSVCASSIPGSS